MKILYVTTIGTTMRFFTNHIQQLLKAGNQVDIATNENNGTTPVPSCYREWGCKVYGISCSRMPFKAGNIKSISEIKRIVKNNGYEIVHCHTPIASACTRIACKSFRKSCGMRVFYTAHGFHFYKGSPIWNWVCYYPMERLCARWTDVLITINREDYNLATSRFHAKKVIYIPGVGIDTAYYADLSGGDRVREEIGIDNDELMLLSVGELNANKNHEAVIKAVSGMNLTYVIVGEGDKRDDLVRIAQENDVNLVLVGFRNDVKSFYDAANVFILPSIREGLNVSLMEAMASGLPCLVGRIRGNVDLIQDDQYRFNPLSVDSIRDSILRMRDKPWHEIGKYNREYVKSFDKNKVCSLMEKVYTEE